MLPDIQNKLHPLSFPDALLKISREGQGYSGRWKRGRERVTVFIMHWDTRMINDIKRTTNTSNKMHKK